MTRWLIGLSGPLLVLACFAAPVAVAVREQRHLKNFHVVRPGVLYRSAQLTPEGLKRVVFEKRIRTVVNLREGTAAVDVAEEAFCAKEEIRFVRLYPRGWDGGAGNAAVDDNVRTFLEVMHNPANYPVLVHCFAGIHRTGAYCAVFRMEFEGWDNGRAIAEVKALGYDNFDNELDIRGWLEGYKVGCLGRGSSPDRTPSIEQPTDDKVSFWRDPFEGILDAETWRFKLYVREFFRSAYLRRTSWSGRSLPSYGNEDGKFDEESPLLP